ncbi:heterokaryon incompatibility protein-domain-containing protein, partial [Aspergillus avenaceus]
MPYFDRAFLPLTIQDALTACDKLGYKYIWIDQICINQNDPKEKQEQINQMDCIYQGAVCTLVGLAGVDSNHGLPGITRPRAWKFETVEIGDLNLTLLAPPRATCSNYSTWITRGWTFQEGILSSQLLFFTEYGVYFGCQDANGGESADASKSEISSDPTEDPNNFTLDRYWRTVDQYSVRKLTNPSDILNAFSAVLRVVYGDDTIYGLPLREIDKAVLWWHSEEPSEVRNGYPSWSWASHNGPISHHLQALAGLAIFATRGRESANLTVCKPAPNKKWDSYPPKEWQTEAIMI